MRLRWVLVVMSVAVTLLTGAAARAADVTEVPEGINTEAVKVFRSGLALHKDKKYAAAIPLYERAIALGGRFPEAFNNLAYCYRKIGQIDKSIDLYKTAIAL